MLNLKAILMALSGVVVVGGIGTYVVLENRKSQEAPVEVSAPATTNQAVSGESASTETDAASTQTEEVASSTEQAASEAASPTADWVMPAFDLLRVEPDGSTVIAGRGQPNTSLKIMNGEEMIAETDVGASGDFVVIFDEALNSGDYQLSLKVEDENGLSVTSEETAIVSVPEDESGQLLAMVQKPGAASRIITQPEAALVEETTTTVESATTATEDAVEKVAEVVANTEATAEEAATEVAEVATDVATAVEEKAAEVASSLTNGETATAVTTEAETIVTDAKDAVETVMEKATENAADAADKVMENTEEAMETAKAAVEGTGNVVAALTSENGEASDVQAATTNEQPQEEKVEIQAEEAVVEDPVAEKPAVEKPKAPSENVRIEAVEVEGDKLFVAGSGTAGYQVRVFANDEEVGIANVESNGRFIIEATKDLEVGQHQITAALEDKQTNQVILRAIVPFNRPEGQALAAVASNEGTSAEDKPVANAETETAMVKEEPESTEAETATSTETPTKNGSETAGEAEPEAESDPQVASSSEEATTTETSDQTVVADNQVSEKPVDEATETMTKEEEVTTSEETTIAASDTSTSTETTSSETEQADSTDATAQEETVVATSNDNQVSEPKTIVQDELQPASSQSVIIRRGDTLWQIARRTYGAGVRYTTIYLANQQQIDNPDRIAPGQIFEVPEEALENSEQLHRQRLGVE
ncbi:MAG: LysM peptidoglycan-binding domain-containing protein [Lentilitoribacter sp.]